MGVKVFQIGFNKVATGTLFRFFKVNGVPSVHWDHGAIAERFAAHRSAGRDPFGDYPDVCFFADMTKVGARTVIEVYKDFPYIYEFYPDALYILNTRNVDDWLRSRLNHPRFVERYRRILGRRILGRRLLGWASEAAVVAHWRKEWEEHHANVRAFFADKPGQLLEFDIDKHGPAELAAFVRPHYRLDPKLYRSVNVTSIRLEAAKRTAKPSRFPLLARVVARLKRLVGTKGSVRRPIDAIPHSPGRLPSPQTAASTRRKRNLRRPRPRARSAPSAPQ